MAAHRVVRHQSSHIFQTITSQTVVASALCTGHPLPLEDSFYSLLLVAVNPRAIVWLEVLGELKNQMTSLGIKPMNIASKVDVVT
jgi:hypothetical protein